MADDSSELSELSSVASIDSESENVPAARKGTILKYFPKLKIKPAPTRKEPTPPPRKRSPSPPHEPGLADNPDIAFLVMYRSRFSDCFPKSLPHFGPQEIERDVTETMPGEQAEQLLCAILGLLLNRKQDVKPGHYNRALEDAISTHKSQWARAWGDKSPLSGSTTFATMTPTERITLLRTLAAWSLSSSEAIRGVINLRYKQSRQEDDLNPGLSVQPWGSDSDRRRYYLIEGEVDTAFRIYRESNPAGFNRTWQSVAGDIEELRALAAKLTNKDGGPKAKQLSQKILNAISRFEATEEKRKRREYRQIRKAQLKRPEPGHSLYEGRTRGKRIKYTYDDDDDFDSDSTTRRSTRNTRTHTPTDPAAPVTTARGRQIRAPERMGATTDGTQSVTAGIQGDNLEEAEISMVSSTGRPRRSAAVRSTVANGRARSSRLNEDSTDDASEPDYGDDDEDDADEHVPEEEEEEDEEEEEEDEEEEEEEGGGGGEDEREDEFDDNEVMVEDELDEGPPQKPRLIVKLSTAKWKAHTSDPSDGSIDMPDAFAPVPGTPATEAGASHPNPHLSTPKSSPPDDDKVTVKGLQSTSLAFRDSPDKTASPAA